MSEMFLIDKYKKLVGIDNIITNGGDTTIVGNVTILSNLFVSNNSIINNDLRVMSQSSILGNTISKGDISISSKLNVLLNTYVKNNITNNNELIINNNATILNTLFVSNNSIINNNVTILNTLYVKNTLTANSSINVNNIYSNTDTINIISNVINIGNDNTTLNLNGTTINILNKDLSITDKLISLNYDEVSGNGIDIGNDSGLVFYNKLGSGYIKTNSTADRFLILPPGVATEKYIATIDMSDNLVISGNSFFNGDVIINNILNVKKTALFNNDITVNNNLTLSGDMIVENNITVGGQTFVIANTNIINDVTVGNNLYVSDIAIINNNVTINSKLNVSGVANIYGDMTVLSSMTVNDSIFCNNDISISSMLIGNNNAFNSNNVTVGNCINIINSAVLNSISIGNTLFVSNNTIIKNNVTINSNLLVSGDCHINGSASFGKLDSITTILGQLYTSLPEYVDNAAALLSGLPIWGLYRTGGIVKVTIIEISPVISFSGLNSTNNILSLGDPLIFNDVMIVTTDSGYPISTVIPPSYVYYEYPGGSTTTATSLTSTILGTHRITYNIYDYFGNLGIGTLNITISNNYFPFVINLNIAGKTYTNNNYLNSDLTTYKLNYTTGINESNLIPSYALGAANDPKIYLPTFDYQNSESVKSVFITNGTYSLLLSKQFLISVGYNIKNSWTFVYKIKNISFRSELLEFNYPVIPLDYYFSEDPTAIQPRYGNTYTFGGGHRNEQTYENMGQYFQLNIHTRGIFIYIIPITGIPSQVTTMMNNITYTYKLYSNTDQFTVTKNGPDSTLLNTEVTNMPDISVHDGVFTTLIDVYQGYFLKNYYDASNNKYYIIMYDRNGIKRIEIIVNNINLNTLFAYRSKPSEVDFIMPHALHLNVTRNKFYEGVVYKSGEVTDNVINYFPSTNVFT